MCRVYSGDSTSSSGTSDSGNTLVFGSGFSDAQKQSSIGSAGTLGASASSTGAEVGNGVAVATSIAVGGMPVVGSAVSAAQIVTGRDLFTGEVLDRRVEAFWLVVGMTPFSEMKGAFKLARMAKKEVKAVANSADQGIFGARGPYSGRLFEPTEAGGPLRDLTTDNIKVTNRGIEVVEKHTSRFGPAAPAFDMPGYGFQGELPSLVKDLLSSNYLERVTK